MYHYFILASAAWTSPLTESHASIFGEISVNFHNNEHRQTWAGGLTWPPGVFIKSFANSWGWTPPTPTIQTLPRYVQHDAVVQPWSTRRHETVTIHRRATVLGVMPLNSSGGSTLQWSPLIYIIINAHNFNPLSSTSCTNCMLVSEKLVLCTVLL